MPTLPLPTPPAVGSRRRSQPPWCLRAWPCRREASPGGGAGPAPPPRHSSPDGAPAPDEGGLRVSGVECPQPLPDTRRPARPDLTLFPDFPFLDLHRFPVDGAFAAPTSSPALAC